MKGYYELEGRRRLARWNRNCWRGLVLLLWFWGGSWRWTTLLGEPLICPLLLEPTGPVVPICSVRAGRTTSQEHNVVKCSTATICSRATIGSRSHGQAAFGLAGEQVAGRGCAGIGMQHRSPHPSALDSIPSIRTSMCWSLCSVGSGSEPR